MRLPTSVCFPLEVRERGRERSRTRRLPARPSYPYSAHASADASRQQGEVERGSDDEQRPRRHPARSLLSSPESFSLGVGVSVYLRASPSSSSHWLHSLSSPLRLLRSQSVRSLICTARGLPLSLPTRASEARRTRFFAPSLPPPPLCVGVCLLKSGEEWRRRRRLLQLQCAEEAGKEAGSLE